jgi:hypothetical protein
MHRRYFQQLPRDRPTCPCAYRGRVSVCVCTSPRIPEWPSRGSTFIAAAQPTPVRLWARRATLACLLLLRTIVGSSGCRPAVTRPKKDFTASQWKLRRRRSLPGATTFSRARPGCSQLAMSSARQLHKRQSLPPAQTQLPGLNSSLASLRFFQCPYPIRVRFLSKIQVLAGCLQPATIRAQGYPSTWKRGAGILSSQPPRTETRS